MGVSSDISFSLSFESQRKQNGRWQCFRALQPAVLCPLTQSAVFNSRCALSRASLRCRLAAAIRTRDRQAE